MRGDKFSDWLQRFSELMMNVILLGFFWTLTSLGIVTVGASSTALNASMRAYLLEKEKQPLKVYFRTFKAQFKLSTLVWLLHLLVVIVLAVDLLYYSVGTTTADTLAMVAVSVLLTLLVFEMTVVYACMVQYSLSSVREVFTRSFDFAFRCFKESLMLLFLTATVLVAGVFLFRGILPFAMGIITCVSWKLLPSAFQRYHTKTAATRKAEARMEEKKKN